MTHPSQMSPPLSRRPRLRQSLSDHARSTMPSLVKSSTRIFENRKETWLEPEKSVGTWFRIHKLSVNRSRRDLCWKTLLITTIVLLLNACPSAGMLTLKPSIGRSCQLKFKNTECWEVVGPARELFDRIAPAIDKLLEDNQESLEQGESKPRGISFNMWMEGSRPSSAQPIIVFSSKSRRQRLYAKALLKGSEILVGHPGVAVKALDRMPAVHQAKSLPPDPSPLADRSRDIFMTNSSVEAMGAQISFGNSKIATMLGIVEINGKKHTLVPQHPRFDTTDQDLDSLPGEDHLLEFDDESESEDDNLADITSTGKCFCFVIYISCVESLYFLSLSFPLSQNIDKRLLHFSEYISMGCYSKTG